MAAGSEAAVQPDPAILVARLLAGDVRAFEDIVRWYGPRLLAVARRIVGSEEDARECVQDAFLAVHRSIQRLENPSALGSWLHRTATNAALMKLRSRRARPEESIETLLPSYDRFGFRDGPVCASPVTPEEMLQRVGNAQLVRDAIQSLPDTHRTVLLLRDIDGYNTKETAELLGTSPGAVKVRLHRARSALKELMQPLFDE